ncbi:phenylacetate-CoA ligase [Cohnella sp. SGD-V74]|uniref:AMP-binding protein n=1 Tax=unclassified Cohnella TaxID=2636738 RepID=UPI000B8BBF69|nr:MULTISPECIES: AMP-binding protein [unclassified Cohnella]PRX71974.1 phenylacetate-CoA ligase [Cohnella sp. SGD-V74]
MSASPFHDKIDRTVRVFPWYGQLLADAGIDRFSVRSIDRLPLMTSELLERYYYSRERPYAEDDVAGRVTSYRTSGTSTNRRKTIFYSAEDESHYVRIKAEMFRRMIAPTGASTALSDMGTGHAAGTALDVFARIGIAADSISFEQPIVRHLERLRTLRPHVLYTMPSILDRLLEASEDDPASYGIRGVVLVGEIAAPAWRRSVAGRLGLNEENVTDTYGSIEIGTIAGYSHEHGRYLFAEGIKAEGVPAEGLGGGMEPLQEGESVLVLTSFVRELFPALRFVTYDVVRDLRPIRVNGQWRQSFEAIVRRIGPELKHGEKISVYDIENVVYRHLKEANVAVRVRGNKLSVHVGSRSQADPAVYESIERELAERIPEIGAMIRGGILEAIRVVPEEASCEGTAIKRKKIFYD